MAVVHMLGIAILTADGHWTLASVWPARFVRLQRTLRDDSGTCSAVVERTTVC
jgi:hypothetical protein